MKEKIDLKNARSYSEKGKEMLGLFLIKSDDPKPEPEEKPKEPNSRPNTKMEISKENEKE